MHQSITFLGAARTVTGSRHLLELDRKLVLVDCGLFQGQRELRALNWEEFPVDPAKIDAVVITHAHTDHIGYLPKLVREGFQGPIYATQSSVGIAKISLPDGGRLQEEEAEHRNRKGLTRHDPALPLFTEADAYRALKRFSAVRFGQDQKLPGGATLRFHPAGHILGSALAEIFFANGERIVFSGDLGRYDRPLLQDPARIEFAEYLVLESTYGDRLHSTEDPMDLLEGVLKEAYEKRSVVLVPSFAIGRTQELLYYINQLVESGRVPSIAIYVDSPMANATTLLYNQKAEDLDIEAKQAFVKGDSPLEGANVVFVRDRAASKQLNDAKGPMVVIAGSGMLSGGRIIFHLQHRLDDPSTTVLITGYQAAGTKGRELLEGAQELFLHKHPVKVRAKVIQMTMLSAHADYEEMFRWLAGFRSAPRRTFLVHGELPVQEVFAAKIRERLGWEVNIPERGDRFEL